MAAAISNKIKFHYSYGGKLRDADGKLRYADGTNGILAVDRGITYTELIVKLWDTCGPSMSLRCQLPDDDINMLVHVMSDDDLAYVIEVYDRYCGEDYKIRTILDDPVMLIKPMAVNGILGRKATQCSVS